MSLLRNLMPKSKRAVSFVAVGLGLILAVVLVAVFASGGGSEECSASSDSEECVALESAGLETRSPNPGSTPQATRSATTEIPTDTPSPTATPEEDTPQSVATASQGSGATPEPTGASANGPPLPCPDPCVTITNGAGFNIGPEPNTTYQCAPGVVLDGLNREDAAFDGDSGADNVTIQNCVIQNYASEIQYCAIDGRDTSGWRILNNEIRENAACGLEAGSNSVVRGNYVHHNHQMGVKAVGARNALFENNEVAFNNYLLEVDPYFEAGGSKFLETDGLIARGNYFHHNRGPGIWTDFDNVNVLIENNRVEFNELPGIFHEISFSAVIRNNHVEGNGCSEDFNSACANIFIANSVDVEVYGNTVIMSANTQFQMPTHGILVAENDRDEYISGNIYVHHNDITYIDGGVSGTSADRPDIRFDYNTYRGANVDTIAWIWDDPMDFAEFQAAGQEANGQVIP